MKFKVHEGNGTYDEVGGKLLETILKNRGIEDWKRFLSVSEKEIFDGRLMKNMSEGCHTLKKHIDENSVIYVEVDSDADGYSSSAIIINFIRDINPNTEIIYNIKDGKEHGIQLNKIDTDRVNLIIVPDAGSNDVEECLKLHEQGIEVLVLDHHEIDKENPHATIINCMDGEYPNQSLSGANVVYKFIEEYCKIFKLDYNYTKFLSLVALANVADSIDMRSLEARQYTMMGIKQIEEDVVNKSKGHKIVGSEFIQAVVEKGKDRELKHINITSIGWFISPKINGTIRFGNIEEKTDLFRSMLNEQEDREYQPRRKSKDDPKPEVVIMSLHEEAVRQCTNAKARQDKAVKLAKEKLKEKIEEKGLNDNKVLMVDATDLLDKTLTGLVANKLSSEYKKPVLLFKKMNDKVYGGSARNYSLSPVEDFRGFINDLNIFGECMGHQGAFGIKIEKEKMIEARDAINEKLKDVEMVDTWIVDYKIPVRRIKEEDILQLGLRRDIWGNSVHKPLFAITGITIPTADIQLLGEKENILAFKVGNLKFIKFFTNKDEYNQMIMRDTSGFGKSTKTILLELIVEFSVNEYEGRNYPECIIVDWNSQKPEEVLF